MSAIDVWVPVPIAKIRRYLAGVTSDGSLILDSQIILHINSQVNYAVYIIHGEAYNYDELMSKYPFAAMKIDPHKILKCQHVVTAVNSRGVESQFAVSADSSSDEVLPPTFSVISSVETWVWAGDKEVDRMMSTYYMIETLSKSTRVSDGGMLGALCGGVASPPCDSEPPPCDSEPPCDSDPQAADVLDDILDTMVNNHLECALWRLEERVTWLENIIKSNIGFKK